MKLKFPIDGYPINQHFGETQADYSQFGMKGHNGIDIGCPKGTPIHAVHSGYIIEQVSKDSGYGLRISQRWQADGKHYLGVYGHMQRLAKDIDINWNWGYKEYFVNKGDVIGYVNSTGYSFGNHLHFGLHEYNEHGVKLNANNGYGGAIDPEPFFLGMDNEFVKTINIAGTVGIVVLADNVENFKFLCKQHAIDPEITSGGEIKTDYSI